MNGIRIWYMGWNLREVNEAGKSTKRVTKRNSPLLSASLAQPGRACLD